MADIDLRICAILLATGRNSRKFYLYFDGSLSEETENDYLMGKPNTEMYQEIIQDLPYAATIWIVGDEHTDNHSDDWGFAQNCQKLDPNYDVRYVPIEMLDVYWNYFR